MTVISYANGAAFQRRLNPGDVSIHTGNSGAVPYWVRLTRTGNVFRGYASANGTNWTLIDTATVVMPAIVYVGLVTTAHNNSALNTSTLDNISLITPPLKLSVVTVPATNGQFRLQFQAQPGVNYTVEMSTNLQAWIPLVTNLPVNGQVDFIDLNATNSQRFYRVRQ